MRRPMEIPFQKDERGEEEGGEGRDVFQCRRCLIPSSEIKILTGTETHPTFPSRPSPRGTNSPDYFFCGKGKVFDERKVYE